METAADSAAATDATAGTALPFTSAWTRGKLEVTVLDVGQGDGLGIRCPDGRIILVDAGTFSAPTLAYLRAVDTTVVDALILTHPHMDHIGGALDVIRQHFVRRVYDCGYRHPTSAYLNLLTAIESDSRIDYFQPRRGQRLDWGPRLDVRVLHPDTPTYEDINDNSIVLRLALGEISFVLTGDAEAVAERAIVARGGSLRSTVLKVGHHGSRSSTTEEFLAAVAPQMAAISCGHGNSYGHPKPQTLERLERHGIRTYRTDLEGWISFLTDGVTCEVRTARGSNPR